MRRSDADDIMGRGKNAILFFFFTCRNVYVTESRSCVIYNINICIVYDIILALIHNESQLAYIYIIYIGYTVGKLYII